MGNVEKENHVMPAPSLLPRVAIKSNKKYRKKKIACCNCLKSDPSITALN